MVFLTKLKPEPMGAHSLSVDYGVNSLVMSEDGAAAYISVKDVPAGTPLSNTDYWQPHTDLTAVRQSAEAAAQKANAARDEMLEIARNLTDAVEKSGNPVQAELVGGLPFDRVATALEPIRAGSGDPSPTNIRPITGWTGAELARRGKNLINLTFAQSGLVIVQNADGTITATNNTGGNLSGARCEFTGILPAGTYTISKNNTRGDVFLQTSSADYSNNITTYTFNYDGESYLRVLCSNVKAGESITYKIQIEPGSTATAYEPYVGDTYAVSFGQTVYGGTLDWLTGVLTLDTGYKAFDGTEGFIENDKYYLMYPDNIPNDGDKPVVSSHFKKLESLVEGEFDGVQGISLSWGLRFYLRATYSTLDEFKAYLAAQYAAGTPVQVVYKLATPTTIQLTPRGIRQLQGMNTLYGDGSISITGRANPALALDARIAALEAAALAE